MQARASRSAAGDTAKKNTTEIPSDVNLANDIPYREGDAAWKLDLAQPKAEAKELRPAVVFLHGGGWMTGDKKGKEFLGNAVKYAQKGYVGCSLNYRLSDDAPFPAAVQDVKCAVRWLRAHAADYHVDPDRIGCMGFSAGGQLALMLGLASKEAGFDNEGPNQDMSSQVQAVVDVSGPSDFDAVDLTKSGWSWVPKEGGFLYGPEETFAERKKKASPVTYVTRDAPPLLIVQGADDVTVPVASTDALVALLKKVGAKDVAYLRLDGAGHGVLSQKAEEVDPAMEKFFERTLKK